MKRPLKPSRLQVLSIERACANATASQTTNCSASTFIRSHALSNFRCVDRSAPAGLQTATCTARNNTHLSLICQRLRTNRGTPGLLHLRLMSRSPKACLNGAQTCGFCDWNPAEHQRLAQRPNSFARSANGLCVAAPASESMLCTPSPSI